MKINIEVKLEEKFLEKITWQGVQLYTYPGVFTFGRVDEGTELLFGELAKESALAQGRFRILDFGCGTGALSLALAKQLPGAQITGVDVDPRAVALAQRNVELNKMLIARRNLGEGGGERVKIVGSNMFDAFIANDKFDYIVTNIPSHLTKEIQREMIAQIKAHLAPKGQLWLVAQRRIKDLLKRLMNEILGSYQNVNFNDKYVVMKGPR